MKTFLYFFLVLQALSFHLFAQIPQIEWDNAFGGSGTEALETIVSADGDYLLGGTSASILIIQ